MANIQEIMEEYAELFENSELFSLWEKELLLRRQARQCNLRYDERLTGQSEELDFLLRSLYFAGRKNEFFTLLINNLHNLSILQWLVNASSWLLADLLEFLPWHISNHKIEPRKLQFLVNLYQEQHNEAFVHIVNVLNLESCVFLQSRTANPALRKLFKTRQDSLLKERIEAFYGLDRENTKSPLYPTLYGDKATLLLKTLELFQAASSRNFPDPYGAERFELLLQAAESLFQCGMAEDSLVLLKEIYDDYQQKNRLVEFLQDEKIYKHFYKILRRVIPVYSLLLNPAEAGSCALSIYNGFFARVEADIYSLQYLYFYESIARASSADSANILLELLCKTGKITDKHHNKTLLGAEDLNLGIKAHQALDWKNEFEQKFFSLPHEAFVMMELIRFLQLQSRLEMSAELAAALLEGYIKLWKWIPCRLFFPAEIGEQLAPLAGNNNRYEAQRLLDNLNNYKAEKFAADLSIRPELFRKKSENIRREIFTGKFTGVL